MLRLPRLSTFPLDKPFTRLEPVNAISEVALRLVVNFYSDEPYVIGTATVLAGHLLVTARHVLLEAIPKPSEMKPETQIDNHIVAIQIVPGPHYFVWDVTHAIVSPWSDIALLRLSGNPSRSDDSSASYPWKAVRINPFPPAIGERVVAFGYHTSRLKVSRNSQGGRHIDLDDEPTASIGIVRQAFEKSRDAVFLPFPCYYVGARFEGGMSGGPVFEETGSLCGIVCATIVGSHLEGEPISYVATSWPMFSLQVDADRKGKRSDVKHPLIELVRGGVIQALDLPRLEDELNTHHGPLWDKW